MRWPDGSDRQVALPEAELPVTPTMQAGSRRRQAWRSIGPDDSRLSFERFQYCVVVLASIARKPDAEFITNVDVKDGRV